MPCGYGLFFLKRDKKWLGVGEVCSPTDLPSPSSLNACVPTSRRVAWMRHKWQPIRAKGRSFSHSMINSTSGNPPPINTNWVTIIGRPSTAWAELIVWASGRGGIFLIGKGSHCLGRQPADHPRDCCFRQCTFANPLESSYYGRALLSRFTN